MVISDQIDEDHPLVLEISSLKAAATRFQDEAHSAALKLQRFSLDTSTVQDRVAHLERENELLKTELAVLRANPHPDLSTASNPAALQAQELTLSLRRLSDKLSLTEQALLERSTELAHATSEVSKSRLAVEGAYALAARTRGREEEGKVRERELERKIRELKEEIAMEDLVVKEYAKLVRTLEGRNNTAASSEFPSTHSNGSTTTLIDGISEGKAGLQRLFSEFSAESERLHAEVERLKGELDASNTLLQAERKAAETDRILLAEAQKELQMLKLEDKSAASMVSRYMRFSQASTNSLQNSFNILKTRHSATIDTFTNQLASLSSQLQSSQATSERLRSIVDELGKDIMREGHGRRREIALRLKLVVREEALQEALGRWIRRAQELLDQEHEHTTRSPLEKLLPDARAVYAVLDTPTAARSPLPPVPDSQYSPYSAPAGSLARIIAAEASIQSLAEELQIQTARRQELELVAASNEPLPPVLVKDKLRAVSDSTEGKEVNSTSSDELEVNASYSSPSETTDQAPIHTVETLATAVNPDTSPSGPPQPKLPSEERSLHPLPLPLDGPLAESSSAPEHSLHKKEDSTEASSSSVVFSSSEGKTISFAPEEIYSSEAAGQHPLIDELTRVSHRYDELQRAFRDCHLALQELRKMISSAESDTSPSTRTINGVSTQLFQAAVERLDNYNEDARVELEIRAADEALLAQGYQTMLTLSGSSGMISPLPSAHSFSQDSSQESELTATALEAQIREFTSGIDLNIQRAHQSLSRKLSDVQNDIAVLKRAMHDPDAFGPSSPSTSPIANGFNASSSVSNAGWTSWIRGVPSRPASPSPAPTFGHVMTSPRLKHSPSFQRDLGARRGSMVEPNPQQVHPFSNLDLRVAMPAYSSPSSSKSAVFSPPGIDWHGPRARTVSTMNMLGLGTPGGPGGNPRPQRVERTPSSASEVTEEGKEGSEDDVE
ncbi:hypothetical protein GYMLUDRAFT_235421 [Collybiopsis luxurians FD-317 M1]|nr:hypothetical protein GYMLUDRAFT_235421 [Collybiopsis luxurians FD-317 M1]